MQQRKNQLEESVALADLISQPASIRILIALLELDQTYAFQLTRKTGHHSVVLKNGLELLMKAKMIRIVPPRVRVRNAGDWYALTTHGRVIAEHIAQIDIMLHTSRPKDGGH